MAVRTQTKTCSRTCRYKNHKSGSRGGPQWDISCWCRSRILYVGFSSRKLHTITYIFFGFYYSIFRFVEPSSGRGGRVVRRNFICSLNSSIVANGHLPGRGAAPAPLQSLEVKQAVLFTLQQERRVQPEVENNYCKLRSICHQSPTMCGWLDRQHAWFPNDRPGFNPSPVISGRGVKTRQWTEFG